MNQTKDERGSVTIWMATATFAMITLVGLAVDLGGQVHAQQRTHDLAAQAARAGAQQVQAPGAIQGRYVRVDAAAARRSARAYLSASGVSGTTRVNGDTITVTARDTYRTKFLGLIGLGRLQVTGTATARTVRTLGGDAR